MVTCSRPSSRITRNPTATTPARLSAALAGRSRRLTGARRDVMNAIVTNMFVACNGRTPSRPRPAVGGVERQGAARRLLEPDQPSVDQVGDPGPSLQDRKGQQVTDVLLLHHQLEVVELPACA